METLYVSLSGESLLREIASEMTVDQYIGLMDAWWIIGEDNYTNLSQKLKGLRGTRESLTEGSTPNIDAAIRRIESKMKEIANSIGTTSDGGRGNYSEML